MIKTVIFDMDGVLVDTEPLHYEVSLLQFEELGITITAELYSTFTGNSNKNIYQKIRDQFGLTHSLDDLLHTKNSLFIDAFNNDSKLELLPGVLNLIVELHQKGMQLIVASSSEHIIIDLVFERFQLGKYFSHRVSGDEFPQSKPHPAIFLKAVELSGHLPNECIVIEDSTNGIKAAKAAGLYCIAYKGEAEGQDQSMADEIIYDFTDLNYDRIKSTNT
ncbi:MAG: HAD family phosphatase [Flavobacterium sp.]|nr:HAD family phosphatase [Flavobacterium sp.]